MATHKSAAKRARQNDKRRKRNDSLRAHTKTELKKALTAVTSAGSRADALKALSLADRAMQKAVSKHLFQKAHASRKVSRVAALLNRKFPASAAGARK